MQIGEGSDKLKLTHTRMSAMITEGPPALRRFLGEGGSIIIWSHDSDARWKEEEEIKGKTKGILFDDELVFFFFFLFLEWLKH